MMRRLGLWLTAQRFEAEFRRGRLPYTSILGLLNHYLLFWSPWRLAWRQSRETGEYTGLCFMDVNTGLPVRRKG